MIRIKFRNLTMFVMATLFAACSSGPSNQELTAEALGQTIALTATAAAAEGFNPEANLQTAEALATAGGQALNETEIAQAGIDGEAQAATATAAAPILAELVKYGVDPSEGHVGWIHPTVTLEIQGFEQYDYINHFIATVVEDFVVSVDITWNTEGGFSGCGIVLRSDGNEDSISQYLTILTRSGNGHAIFSAMDEGEIKNVHDKYAYGLDPLFEWRNDTTNRLTVVARGEIFTIYTNGTKIGEVNANKPPVLALPPAPAAPPAGSSNEALTAYQAELDQYNINVADMKVTHQQNFNVYQQSTPYLERGFVAFAVANRTGKTVCTFDNGWLFLIDN